MRTAIGVILMIDKLEKKLGRFAIKNLIFYILAGYGVGYILYFISIGSGNDIYSWITLSPQLVMQGQIWRLFTWVLAIPQALSFWVIFMFMFYYFIGRALEQELGAFRYNLYMFSGWLFTTVGAMLIYWITWAANGTGISMNVTTYYINMASFLAFAVIYPDAKVYFFGLLPIKIKILAWIDVGLLGLQVMQYTSAFFLVTFADSALVQQALSDSAIKDMYAQIVSYYTPTICLTEIFAIVVSLLNFLIFFICNRNMRRNARRRRDRFRQNVYRGQQANASYMNGAAGYASAQRTAQSEPKKTYRPEDGGVVIHKCTICGRTNITDPQLTFRYCSKCDGNHEYCEDHLFTHTHIKAQ